MIVFDTEDNSAELLKAGKSGFLKVVTQIAGICTNGKRFYNTGNAKEFLKWCHGQGEAGLDVWAFNAQYDIGNLCNKGSEFHLYDFDLMLVKSRFIRGKLQGLNFYDVGNVAGAGNSVGKLGLAVHLPKFGFAYTDEEFATFPKREQEKYNRFKGMSKAELFRNKEYVFRDCEIPMAWLKFVESQCDEMEIGAIPATLGSLCCKAFTAGGGTNWHEATDESRSALMGARVELFNNGGRGRIAYTDINSLYPWAMTQLFPEGFERLDTLEGYGVAAVDVEVPEMRIAPLPWRDENGRLLFPIGKFTGIWTIHEIKNAVRAGATVLKIHWIYGSAGGKAYYRDYITETYKKRLLAESPAESLFWKLLMNNLYGRLAIGGVISRSLQLTEENKNRGKPYGTKCLVDYQMPLPEFSNYLHAAYVLSYARIRLYSFLVKVPPDDLIYCDTDSCIFFCRGEIPFPVNKELGEMKLESWGCRAEPILPKTYVYETEKGVTYKAKGVPKRHAKVFITEKTVDYEAPYKMRESITFYEQDNKRKLSVWRSVSKDLRAKYDKKRKNGKYFLPLKINALVSMHRIKSLFDLVSETM